MYVIIEKCSVCKGKISHILSLPQLPLTGIFIKKNELDTYPRFDQSLMICDDCGHVQLGNMVSPEYLYQDTYTHKSGQSQISKAGNDFFISYLHRLNKTSTDSIFEIGCNDLYLLSQLRGFAKELVGVDPVWQEKISRDGNITILGGFVEDVDMSKIFCKLPDLIISSHTFEHIQDVHKVFESVLSHIEDGTKFLIEVPCLDTLLKTCRFDQVFHQHFNYFSLHSFFNFIQLHNCEFLDYTMNYDYWGGTMLMYFQKGGNTKKENPFTKYSNEYILQRFQIFKTELKNIENIASGIDENIYGFGAAQMLPMIAYHMESKLSFLKAIIDDNEARCNKKLVGLNLPIIHSDSIDDIGESVVMITALDSTKVILKRLHEIFKPKYIIKPIQIS
jgi:hypothetical protein